MASQPPLPPTLYAPEMLTPPFTLPHPPSAFPSSLKAPQPMPTIAKHRRAPSRRAPRRRKERPPPKPAQNGLKTFTMSVVGKLRALNTSVSYTSVADSLVADAYERLQRDAQPYNAAEVDKNVRRRAYDALNVLTSMGFVARNGKDVKWMGIGGFMRLVGLGEDAAVKRRRMEVERTRRRVEEKRKRVEELKRQRSHLESVVRRNVARDVKRVTTGVDWTVGESLEYVCVDVERVALPFLLVSCGGRVEVEMEELREEVVFRFGERFKIWEGLQVVELVCGGGGVG